MAVVLVHQSVAELAVRTWRRAALAWEEGDAGAYGRLVWKMRELILAGDLTSAQARTAYNTANGTSVDSTAWSTVHVPKLNSVADAYALSQSPEKV